MRLFGRFTRGASTQVMTAPPVKHGFSVSIPWLDNADPATAKVSRSQALSVPGILRGSNLIAGTIGSLPLRTHTADMSIVDQALLKQIDPDVPNCVTLADTVRDLIFEGIAYWRILFRDSRGWPVSARHVDADRISSQPPSDPVLASTSLPSGFIPGSGLYMAGEWVPTADIIRFDSPLPSLLLCGARTIRRAMRLEITADNYANSPALRDFFTPKDDADPDDDETLDFLDDWSAARRTRSTGYVPAAFERHEVTALSPADLQLVELQRRSDLAIALLLGLDPEDLGVSTTSRTYQNAIDRRQDRINSAYAPYLAAIQDRLSMGDVTKRGQTVRFDLNDFLKADSKTRGEYFTAMKNLGAVTVDEIRLDESRPPLTAAQKKELKPPAPKPAPAKDPAMQPPTDQPLAPVRSIAASFAAAPTPVTLTFDMSTVENAFSVDTQARTITGLVVPWGQVGTSGGRRWKFTEGSLKFSAGSIGRLKLLSEHDMNALVGRTEKTWSDQRGQWATFKIRRSPEGDQALTDAQDGMRDGLSVGIGDGPDDPNVLTTTDPTDPTITLVTSAPWRETSLVGMPAFAESRVASVTLSAHPERNIDMDPEELKKLMAEAVAAAFAANAKTTDDGSDGGPTPVVEPTRGPATVVEQPIYRFDGHMGQHCFTRDAIAGQRGDAEARERVMSFMNGEGLAKFAAVATTDVNELNPTIQRPDLYVPSLQYDRPLWNLVTTGSVNDKTSFEIPKFASSSGLVADHTEGSEPDEGTFVTTSQTVYPTPLSGQVKLNREVVDQGGSPQADQIIWREMQQAYFDAIELKIGTLLAASTNDLPVVGVDEVLEDSMIDILTDLPFTAGGNRFTALALSKDLFKALQVARDGAGRRLFPTINPVNATGTSNAAFNRISIGALTGIPSWAIANGDSYLFVPGSVYAWASAPNKFTFEYQVKDVTLAIWGYQATATTRAADIKELQYAES